MESFVYFNIAAFAITTLYTFDDSGNERKEILQVVVAYVSVVATFIVFLFVIIFHLYRCGSAKSTLGVRIQNLVNHSEVTLHIKTVQLEMFINSWMSLIVPEEAVAIFHHHCS